MSELKLRPPKKKPFSADYLSKRLTGGGDVVGGAMHYRGVAVADDFDA